MGIVILKELMTRPRIDSVGSTSPLDLYMSCIWFKTLLLFFISYQNNEVNFGADRRLGDQAYDLECDRGNWQLMLSYDTLLLLLFKNPLAVSLNFRTFPAISCEIHFILCQHLTLYEYRKILICESLLLVFCLLQLLFLRWLIRQLDKCNHVAAKRVSTT